MKARSLRAVLVFGCGLLVAAAGGWIVSCGWALVARLAPTLARAAPPTLNGRATQLNKP